jgi:DNA (cytosine-5)-methyltransferase 1
VLQTFPEDFVFEGSKTNLEQMVGNAVPVKLAKFVGDAILDYVDNPNKYKTY